MKLKNAILFTMLSGFFYIQDADAKTRGAPKSSSNKKSTLYINNENKKELDILIKPELIEDHSMDEDKLVVDEREGEWVTFRLPPTSVIELEIPGSELGTGIKLFSVTGETNPFTPIGTCYNLKIGKNYLLRFTNNAVGTDCFSQELKGSFLPNLPKELIKVPHSRSKPHKTSEAEFAPDRVSQTRTILPGIKVE